MRHVQHEQSAGPELGAQSLHKLRGPLDVLQHVVAGNDIQASVADLVKFSICDRELLLAR
jgi:hypothetical protein